jgi:hypothetical protein
VAAVTKAKQVNNNNKKNKVKAVEIVSKKSYERLLRNHDRLTQRVEDLEDVVKHMRYEDTCLKGFIFNYLKPRHRPRITEDGEHELWSEDGKHYSTLHGYTLESTRNIRQYPNYPWGLMRYNKPMNSNRFWQLEGLAEKVAGRKCSVNFSDPKEDEEFDRIGRVMA